MNAFGNLGMAYIYIYCFGSLYSLILGFRECLSLIGEEYVGNRNQKVGVIGCQIRFYFW
jgi:hypothetical protein